MEEELKTVKDFVIMILKAHLLRASIAIVEQQAATELDMVRQYSEIAVAEKCIEWVQEQIDDSADLSDPVYFEGMMTKFVEKVCKTAESTPLH